MGTCTSGPTRAPPRAALTSIETHAGVAISSGRARDGAGAARILEFLAVHVGEAASAEGGERTYKPGWPGLASFAEPPTVRLVAGTSAEYAAYAVRAVQLINTALPHDKRLVLSSDPAPALVPLEDVPDGQIFIDFAPTREDWTGIAVDPADYEPAIADPDPILEYDDDAQEWQAKGMRAGRVWFSIQHLLNQAHVWEPRHRAMGGNAA